MSAFLWLKLKNTLTPPRFPDDDDTYRARLLTQMASILLIMSVISIAPFILSDTSVINILSVIFSNGCLILISLMVIRWTRNGNFKGASTLLISSLLAIVTLNGLVFGIAYFPTTAYILVITVAALFLGARGVIQYGMISTLALIAVIFVNIAFIENPPWIHERIAADTVTNIAFFFVISLLLSVGMAHLEQTLNRSRQAEAEVHRLNTNLEMLVTKRTAELGNVNRLFQALLDNSPVPIYIKTAPDWRYQVFNKKYLASRGLNQAQITDHTDDDLYPPDIVDEIRITDEAVAESKGPVTIEIDLPDGLGKNNTFLSTKFPILDDQKNLYAIGGISLDITERKEVERLLRKQNEYLTALHQITLDLLNRIEPEDILQRLLKHTLRLLDTDHANIDLLENEDEIITHVATPGQPLQKGDRTRRGQAGFPTWQAIETGTPAVVDDYETWPHRRPIFGDFPYHAIAQIPMIRENKPIGVLSIARTRPAHPFSEEDIKTGARLAQISAVVLDNAQLHTAAQNEIAERKRAETMFRGALESAPDAMLLVNDQGRIVVANSQVEKIFGFRREELLNQPVEILIPNHYHERHVVHRSQYAIHPHTRELRSGLNLSGFHKDGREFPAEISLSPLNTEQGTFVIAAIRDITERKQAEEKLHRAEAKYREIYESVNDVIYETDYHGVVTAISPSVEKWDAYLPEEIVGHHVIEFYAFPEDYHRLESAIENQGMVNDFEVRLRKKSGNLTVVSITAQAVFDTNGLPVGTQGVMRDITERKQAEESIRQSENKYRALAEQVPAVVYTDLADGSGKTLYISPYVQNMLGYSPQDWAAQPDLCNNLIHPDDREQVFREGDLALSTEHFALEYRYIARDGHIVWVQDEAVLLKDETGQPKFWQGVMLDITAQKQAKERITQLNSELEQRVELRTLELQIANAFLASLVDTAIVINQSLELNEVLDHILTQCRKFIPCRGINLMLIQDEHAYIARRIGYEGFDELERNLIDFKYPLSWSTFDTMIKTGKPILLTVTEGHPLWHASISNSWIRSFIGIPLIDAEGNTIGFLNAGHDQPNFFNENHVTVLEALANQAAIAIQNARLLQNLKSALKKEQMTRSQLIQSERLALVGRLLASVSHELNNPLQAIQNALFLIKEESVLTNQGRQDLEVILSETERMTALIDRLRSAYRPILKTDFQPVKLNSLIEDVFALIATHMRHKEISFEFFPDADLPPLSGISDQLRQVVLNLFLNAIEMMSTGGRLRVWTRLLPSENEIFLSVRDNGPGIDPDILPHIYDPFITSKQTGTGLGLTITRDIIEQHHGRIEAENDPEGGAVFNVWLPIDQKGGK